MKHGKGIIITTVIIVVICFVAVPLGVNYAFRQEAPVDILAARWDAADTLNYIATSLAFIGTFFLGLVAWKQNNDLQKIETNTFIANNSCEVFLDSIRLKNLNQIACNLDTEHEESIFFFFLLCGFSFILLLFISFWSGIIIYRKTQYLQHYMQCLFTALTNPQSHNMQQPCNSSFYFV